MSDGKKRTQFNISDMICYVLIVGALPLLLTHRLEDRVVALAVVGVLEFIAARWGVEILRAWKIRNFAVSLLVHVYAFIAGICLIDAPVCLILLILCAVDKNFRGAELRDVLGASALTFAVGYSAIVVERKRRIRVAE